jgi:hypothetical protein
MYDDYYFDRDDEDVLHDALKMAKKNGYSDEQCRALREVLLAETRFSYEAINNE